MLHIETSPCVRRQSDPVDIGRVREWLTVAIDRDGREHAVLSDGRHRIRLEPDRGSLAGDGIVTVRYRLSGIVGAQRPLLTLRRFLHLYQYRRFSASLYPVDPRIDRGLHILRVHDALVDGASQRDIAVALFGLDRVSHDWGAGSDALRQRVLRLVRDAKAMACGGYRSLLLRRTTLPSAESADPSLPIDH